LGQRIAAVNNDIEQNQELSSFLSKVTSTDYPNLEAKRLIPTVLPVTATIPSLVRVTIPATPCDKAQFIVDVNYPDGTVVAPGANFTKTWRLKNVGTCPWTTSYQLVFFSGEQMGAPASAAFTQNVDLGQTFDFSISMIAPTTVGNYIGYWMFKNANGALFGIGAQANRPWSVEINVGGPTSTTQVQTQEVLSDIDRKYMALGGSTGFLGNPIGPETNTPDGNGRFREFQGGSIYWTPDTGAHEVHGLILDKWSSLELERGFLGYPTTDESATPDGFGHYNHFQGGSIYWTPDTGVWEVHGLIRDKWASLGWEQSFLGYPLTDETTTADGIGRFNHFQGGSIYWTPNTGAWEVHGYIRDRWAALGWEKSCLGYPISDEEPATDGWERQSRFEHGIIQWSSSKGAVETCN
jgi:uncharacterized protein with LGFP repeats